MDKNRTETNFCQLKCAIFNSSAMRGAISHGIQNRCFRTKNQPSLQQKQIRSCNYNILRTVITFHYGEIQGRIQDFHLGGEGANAHYEREIRSPFRQGSRARLRALEALGVFNAL